MILWRAWHWRDSILEKDGKSRCKSNCWLVLFKFCFVLLLLSLPSLPFLTSLARWTTEVKKHIETPEKNTTRKRYGYGSIPINTIFSGLFTSINPSYFDVNYRGTRFWPIPIWSHDLKDADDFPKIPQAATGRAWAAEGGTTSTAAALKAGPGTCGMLSDWWANQQKWWFIMIIYNIYNI